MKKLSNVAFDEYKRWGEAGGTEPVDMGHFLILIDEIQRLRNILQDIANTETVARDIVDNNRWPSTLAIDLSSKARIALD